MTLIRLHLLGEFRCLAEDGAQVDIALAKDQGLLAILALSPGFESSRSRITDLLWSTRGNEQARASLRQSLWSLKKSIGIRADSLLHVDRRRVGLNPHVVETDVGKFRKLTASATQESLENAVALYRGDLLEGLEIQDKAWQEWLTTERESFRTHVVQALRRLIDHYAAGHCPEELIEAGRKLVDLEPYQEEGHRAMMRGYAESNLRALALKHYERCRELLQKGLDIRPDPATQDLFSQVKAGSIAVQPEDSGPTWSNRFAHDSCAELSRDLAAVLDELPRTAAFTDKPSILIMPFTNVSDDPGKGYLADGVTDNIIVALTRFRELFVFALKTSMESGGRVGKPTEAYEQLGVRYALEGSVQATRGRVRVTARLVDTRSGQHLWAQRYDRDLDDLLAVQDEIARLIVASLVETVEETDYLRMQNKAPQQMAAYDHVLKGRVLLNRSRFVKDIEYEAREHFSRALDLDRNYALAYAGLAVSYSNELHCNWCEQPEQALSSLWEYSTKALELDSTNVMARYSLACGYYFRGEHERASLEIEHAIAINPNDYHIVCAKAWFLTYSGHLEEGLQCSIDAMRTNPYAADGCLETIGTAEYLSGRYDQALLAFGKTKHDSMFKLAGIAACYAQLGRFEEAGRTSREFIALSRGEAPKDGTPGEDWHSYWNRLYKFKDDGDRQHLLDGLRKAGMPVD